MHASDHRSRTGLALPVQVDRYRSTTLEKYSQAWENDYHFGFLSACFAFNVFLPLAPLTFCSSSNFFFAYRLVSASSTNSSTRVRLRLARVKLSEVDAPKGVSVGRTVPI